MTTTFKDRLKILMNGDKPYSWTLKVGIEKGLFQYYWQKGKIPSHKNLMKIQRYTNCSIDWLLTGKNVDMDKITAVPPLEPNTPHFAKRNRRFADTVKKLKKVYADTRDKELEALEYFVDAISEG